MNPLTESEAKQLDGLLKRAIANNQFSIAVASPLCGAPDEILGDEFGDGDRHDGFGYMSNAWKVGVSIGSGEDPIEHGDGSVVFVPYEDRPEIKLLVDDAALRSLAGVEE